MIKLSSYKNRVNDALTISGGFDGRYYIGSHWYQVDDLLGGQFFLDNETDTFAFGKPLQVGDKYNKDYDGIVVRYGLFGQAEYQITDAFNIFVAADVSNSSYKQKEYMNNTITGSRSSDAVNFVGYGFKGGGNYNLDSKVLNQNESTKHLDQKIINTFPNRWMRNSTYISVFKFCFIIKGSI